MRVALVHDYLNQYGGAERVLEAMAEMFPDAPIYTLFYDPEGTFFKFAHRKIITSPIDKIAAVKKRHRLFIPFMPLAAQKLLVRGYDLVLSSSASYAKGANIQGGFHVTYCHTPLRYAWEDAEYVKTHPMFQSGFARFGGSLVARYLRIWDARAARKPNLYFANSHFIAEKIERYYNREATVLYPPVDHEVFYREPHEGGAKAPKKKYFLAAGRMLHYKRFDLVIDAFKSLNLPLKLIGTGPELPALKSRAGGADIEFIDYIEDENMLRAYYNGARALVFPQVEDFGLVAAEAISCGTPVIAYRAGGAQEIVTAGVSGLFFDSQTPEAIAQAVRECIRRRWDPRTIANDGARFSKTTFQKGFLDTLEAQGFKVREA
jgi:glycosyltransferase involved in cell wall biosynthesis